jgi:hypothetical protein
MKPVEVSDSPSKLSPILRISVFSRALEIPNLDSETPLQHSQLIVSNEYYEEPPLKGTGYF